MSRKSKYYGIQERIKYSVIDEKGETVEVFDRRQDAEDYLMAQERVLCILNS